MFHFLNVDAVAKGTTKRDDRRVFIFCLSRIRRQQIFFGCFLDSCGQRKSTLAIGVIAVIKNHAYAQPPILPFMFVR
jgi:hypothetical protein